MISKSLTEWQYLGSATTWAVCSTQPYRTVLHVSCNLFSFLHFFLFMMVSFYTVFSFLSFYTGWILDLPSIGIYSMCPQRDSCGTVSLATIFFSRRTNSLRWRPGVSSYQQASTGWVIACIQYVYNNKKYIFVFQNYLCSVFFFSYFFLQISNRKEESKKKSYFHLLWNNNDKI